MEFSVFSSDRIGFIFILCWIGRKKLLSIRSNGHSNQVIDKMVIGLDQKQFFFSDPTKNKNESDPIRQKIWKFYSIQFILIQLNNALIESN